MADGEPPPVQYECRHTVCRSGDLYGKRCVYKHSHHRSHHETHTPHECSPPCEYCKKEVAIVLSTIPDTDNKRKRKRVSSVYLYIAFFLYINFDTILYKKSTAVGILDV